MELLVAPEVLKVKADETSRSIGEMKDVFQEINDLIDRSKNYWIGEAGDAYRKSYILQKDNIGQIIKSMQEHPEDLLRMAGVYTEAENNAMAIGSGLPDNVIS